MPLTVFLEGKLKSINQYQQLLFNLDETNVKKVRELTKDITGNDPISSWTTSQGKEMFTAKVALKPQDKNVAKNFNNIAAKCSQTVSFGVEICPYDFIKDEERIHGFRLVLISKLTSASV